MERRNLLQGLAAAPLAALAPTTALALPRKSAETTITDLDVFEIHVNRRGNWVLARLKTANGLTGIGDASHGGDDRLTVAYLKQLTDLLRGRQVFDVEWFRQAANQIVVRSAGKARSAASALEQCMWDLIGKMTGQPVHQLFGGGLHDRIPLYANINRSADPRTPEGFAAMARRAVDAGFDAVKLAPFDEMPKVPSDDADVAAGTDHGIACAEAVRQVIGPNRRLLIDVHSRFTLAQGLKLVQRFEPLNLFWLEEVTAEDGFDDLAAINKAAPMTTAGGEALHGTPAFYRYIRSGAVDIVMPDVKLCGGMLELKKIAAIAEAAGVPVSPHGPASPVGTAAAAQVMATVPNFNILEFAYGEVPWRADLLDTPEDVTGGSLALSKKPGLGVELNMKTVARYAA